MKPTAGSNANHFFLSKTYISLKTLTRRLIDYLESPTIPLINCIITFCGCLIIRNFLEFYSQKTVQLMSTYPAVMASSLGHLDASFAYITMIIIILLHYTTKTPVVNVMKVVLPCCVALFLAPIIDFTVSLGEGYNMAYYNPSENVNLLLAYLTYCGQNAGATIGIRIEVALILFGIFLYAQNKTHHFLKGLGVAWAAYTLIFFWAATPFILKQIIELSGFDYQYSEPPLTRYFLVVNFFLGGIIAYALNKEAFKAIIKEIPKLKVLHYELMLLLGICLGFKVTHYPISFQLTNDPYIIANGILLSIAVFLALLFSMFINNLADIEPDKISNTHRALVRGIVDQATYSKIAYTFMVLTFIYALPVGPHAVFMIALVMSIYYIYSASPLRFKRIPILSKLAISGNSLALMLLGFWLVALNIDGFPAVLYFIVLIGFTLSANFIDLKDIKGDGSAGIKTLPVIWGIKKAQWFCGIAFLGTYLSIYTILHTKVFLLLLAVTGLLQCYLLTRKPYRELPILLVHNASVTTLIIYLLYQ